MAQVKKRVNGRDKGGRGERQAKAHLVEWWGCEFARTPGSGAFATITGMTDYAGDVRPVDSDEWFPFSVEVKNAEGWLVENMVKSDLGPLWQYWEQTVRQGKFEGKHPLLMFTRNFQPWWYMTLMASEGDAVMMDEVIPGGKFCLKDVPGTPTLVIGLVSDLKGTSKEDFRGLDRKNIYVE